MYGFGGIPRYFDNQQTPNNKTNIKRGKDMVKCWNLAGEYSQDDIHYGEEK